MAATGVDHVSYFNGPSGSVTVSLASGVGSGDIAEGDRLFEIEYLTGTNFGDRLDGSAGDNVIFGAAGADLISGRAGNDTLFGGGDNDVIFGDGGTDTFYGGAGTDTASFFNNAGGGVTVSLLTGMGIGDIAQGDQLIDIENLVGTNFGDTLSGSDGDNIFNGAGGDDSLEGGGGADTIGGGAGADSLNGGAGIDTVSWANSASAVTFSGTTGSAGDAAGDVVDQVEAYIGSAHDDFIIGRAFVSDTVYGGSGNDFLGGSGVPGDPGDPSGDTLYGGDGIDRVDFSGGSGSITVDLTTGMGFGGNAENDRFDSIEHVVGSLASDTLIGSAGSDTLDGFDSDDILLGNAGADTLIGGAGNDSLSGGLGIDSLAGGDGDDQLLWDDPFSIDAFDGGAGYDQMVVGSVASALVSVSGIEEVVFSSGSSSLFVEADLLGDLERVTANSGGTVQLESADSWTSGTSVGGYTL